MEIPKIYKNKLSKKKNLSRHFVSEPWRDSLSLTDGGSLVWLTVAISTFTLLSEEYWMAVQSWLWRQLLAHSTGFHAWDTSRSAYSGEDLKTEMNFK